MKMRPESEGSRLPRALLPGEGDPGVVHGVEQDPEVVAHHDSALDGQLHVRQIVAYCKNAKIYFISFKSVKMPKMHFISLKNFIGL
jgi:hypothetical protein